MRTTVIIIVSTQTTRQQLSRRRWLAQSLWSLSSFLFSSPGKYAKTRVCFKFLSSQTVVSRAERFCMPELFVICDIFDLVLFLLPSPRGLLPLSYSDSLSVLQLHWGSYTYPTISESTPFNVTTQRSLLLLITEWRIDCSLSSVVSCTELDVLRLVFSRCCGKSTTQTSSSSTRSVMSCCLLTWNRASLDVIWKFTFKCI